MKKILFIAFIALTAFTTTAQENLTWHTDMNKAVAISAEQNKPIFIFFTGSDWCGWCIRLQKEVFHKPDFEKWAKENVILVELDFPRKTKLTPELQQQNYSLSQTFNVKGYPTVWFVSPEKKEDGKVNLKALGKTGYVAGGPEKWLSVANGILETKN